MRKSATDIIPIHILVDRIGPTANVLLAIHFLTGSDVTSKIGTKSAALKITEPQKYLQTFGQETPPHSASMKLAEEYLVKVLKPGSKCKSFNALRLEVMNNATLPNVQDLPCTTASLQGHLKRAFYMVQLYSTILDKLDPLKPTDFGWTLKEKGFMPDPCTRTLPDDLILTCSCKTCKTKRCRCRKNKISCTTFCKCNSCENQDHKFE